MWRPTTQQLKYLRSDTPDSLALPQHYRFSHDPSDVYLVVALRNRDGQTHHHWDGPSLIDYEYWAGVNEKLREKGTSRVRAAVV